MTAHRLRRLSLRALAVAGILVACLPLAALGTFALTPLWRWTESALGIESIGHSGPAGWCFLATYAACLALAGAGWAGTRSLARAENPGPRVENARPAPTDR